MQASISRIGRLSDVDFDFPDALSFFSPYLGYYVKEVLGVGGEAYLSKDPEGAISGLFIYDSVEKDGTIFTRSREVFDYFYALKPFNSLFAELETEHKGEVYDIYMTDPLRSLTDHRFSHEISIADESDVDALERFMSLTHPGINRNWVRVAMNDGDKCLTVRLDNEIAGLGWLSIVNNIGRLHSLYVKPQFRQIGIGRDIFYARLFWLKSKHVRLAFSEIARENTPSSRIAVKGNMTTCGRVFQYFRKTANEKTRSSPAAKF